VKLHYREFGATRPGPPLLLLHGLLGSLINWQRIARRLEGEYRVIVPDLRNHGRSPHHPDVSYPSMAEDLVELVDGLGLEEVVPVGHSMGGKIAMWLALTRPERVARLVAVDIAPVRYGNHLASVLDALLALPLERIERRADADRLLARRIPERAVRDYLLQNLVRGEAGWRWRADLRALRDGLELIRGFPEVPEGRRYPGPTFGIRGRRSDYVTPEQLPRLKALFPLLRMVTLDTGHWVYAERPEEFLAALRAFL